MLGGCFFFQAEDGIRDYDVTGVQTCALPISLPKVFASQSAWKVVTWASEIHGGYGYMRDVGFEKLLRDAAAFLHSDGVNRTLLLKAANFMY